MSGIVATDAAKDAYQQLSRSKIQYVVFKIDKVDGSECIVVDKTGERGENDAKWKEFTDGLPKDEGRYAVFDFRWTQGDGRKRDSICFVSWTPDDCKIREKMIYGSTGESFKGALQGIKSTIFAHDMEDLDEGRSNVLK